MADGKREIDDPGASPQKKLKSEDSNSDQAASESDRDGGPPPLKPADGSNLPFVPPGTVGVTTINDNDVLSGRGGGTNLHPGNRQFRDLINLYRRDYLKARKNDKPSISRSIVNTIRERNGRFLKKMEKSGLFFEIGDDAAREKTSQALRQRAPEMRKLLLDHEMEGARAQQQQMIMGVPGMPPLMMSGMNMPMMMPNGAFNPAMMGMPNPAMFNPAMMAMPPLNFNQMPQPPQGSTQNVDGSARNGENGNGGDGNTTNNGSGDGNNNDSNNVNNNNNNMAAMNHMMAMGMMPPGMMPMGMNLMVGTASGNPMSGMPPQGNNMTGAGAPTALENPAQSHAQQAL